MAIKPLTILGYELTTPKFTGDSYDIDRFDFETLYYFFNKIINYVPLKERAFKKYNKMINLISFNQTEDANLYEGVFITARYGKEQEIIDILEQVGTGLKPKNHGVKNEVHFLIDRRTGLLLLEKDAENVAGKNFIYRFIRYHKNLIEDYQTVFNKQFDPLKIHKNNFLKVISLPPKTFFEEIKEFATVKEAYYFLDIDKLELKSNEASNVMYLYDKAKENGMNGMNRVKVSFENTIKKSSVRGIQNYFKKLFESQNFDGIGVKGKLHSGRYRTIELENIQRAFDIEVEYNENGLPSLSDITNGMTEIVLKDNPISYKRTIQQYEGVVVNGTKKEDRKV
ncbi:hypothetical protein J32TS6_04850 [Virgibacillus pantothenticus]|uniref:hypothetical protein n=1 Tax=Virgibacillus pantothenticus TaxID=1473 RepID=UPI001B204C57|nr:hypothetical protein [Virgibacillus pantothenticus]GIP61930.1 hypothetical protein J32TS6_04850 [Virgibacillus pantothenticus]